MSKYNTYILIISLLLFGINLTYSFDDENNINTNNFIENTEINIKGAYLMEQYTKKLKLNLKTFEKNYEIKNNENIKYYILKLDSIESNLKKLQRKNIDKIKAEQAMKIILDDLKNINNDIKILLKDIKEKFITDLENYKEKYSNTSIKLSNQLDNIINQLVNIVKNKNMPQKNKNEVINYLKNLENESKNLKNFKLRNYKNKSEVKNYLLSILKSIKTNIVALKRVL